MIEVSVPKVEQVFGEYGVTARDKERYLRLIESGEVEAALDEFVRKYIDPYSDAYSDQILAYVRKSSEGEMSKQHRKGVDASVVALSVAIGSILGGHFSSFLRDSLGPPVFRRQNIRNSAVREAILSQTLQEFRSKTEGRLVATQVHTLESIRNLQTEYIIQNQRLARLNLTGRALQEEQANFRAQLRQRHPQIFADMEAGRVIRYQRGNTTVGYPLKEYIEMSTRTTVLNVERTAVEVEARVAGADVVEYYLADPRAVKEPREICTHIMGDRRYGVPILALNSDTAAALGIRTVNDAREEGAMGVNCRHSIRPISNSLARRLSARMASGEVA